jgi:UDP-N-acetylglucosamine 2-epimerase (non-hydrolysing)
MIVSLGKTVKLKTFQRKELTRMAAVVLGTRPEIIKLGPVILALKKTRTPFFVIHTGQHYSMKMDGQFFKDLGLPKPKYVNKEFARLQRGLSHGEQTAEILCFVERILLKEKPRCVVVEGDTNTVLGAALAARKLGMFVAHVEAGLRSGDWRMPEEHNRVMTDHISDLLLAPTEAAARNLDSERVRGRIIVAGNTIVDAVLQNRIRARDRRILRRLKLSLKQGFILCTAHREENVDNLETIQNFVAVLEGVAAKFGMPIAFVAHPRTKNRLQLFGQLERLRCISGLKIIEPVGYLDFLCLLSTCRLALTDSGGVQEEACILRVPCVTLRDNTERPETVKVGANLIAGMEPASVRNAVDKMLRRPRNWKNPFGDGRTSQRIVRNLRHILDG